MRIQEGSSESQIYWEDKCPYAENHPQVKSLNSVCCETNTTPALVGIVRTVLGLWEHCWDSQGSVTAPAVAVQASGSTGGSSSAPRAGRESAQRPCDVQGKRQDWKIGHELESAQVWSGSKSLPSVPLNWEAGISPDSGIHMVKKTFRSDPVWKWGWQKGGSKGAPCSTCRHDGGDLKLTYMSSLYDASGGSFSFLLSV